MAQDFENLQKLEAAANVVPPDVAAARLALTGVGTELIAVQDKKGYLSQAALHALKIADGVEGDVKVEFNTHAESMQTLAKAFSGDPRPQATQTEGKKQTGAKKQKPAS